MREFDGSRSVQELLEEASGRINEESDKAEDALPEHPGLFTMSRRALPIGSLGYRHGFVTY